jgi:predicted metal-binding protein
LELWWVSWNCGGSVGTVVGQFELWWVSLNCGGSVGTAAGQIGTVLKGHEFTRAVKSAKQTWALAPEGRFLEIDRLPEFEARVWKTFVVLHRQFQPAAHETRRPIGANPAPPTPLTPLAPLTPLTPLTPLAPLTPLTPLAPLSLPTDGGQSAP